MEIVLRSQMIRLRVRLYLPFFHIYHSILDLLTSISNVPVFEVGEVSSYQW